MDGGTAGQGRPAAGRADTRAARQHVIHSRDSDEEDRSIDRRPRSSIYVSTLTPTTTTVCFPASLLRGERVLKDDPDEHRIDSPQSPTRRAGGRVAIIHSNRTQLDRRENVVDWTEGRTTPNPRPLFMAPFTSS